METCQVCRGHGYLPPERRCANDNCEKLFRWQEGRSKSTRSRIDAIYCSQRCAKAQSERRRRAERIEQRPAKVAEPVKVAPRSGEGPLLLPVYPETGQALGGLGRTKVYELISSGALRTVKIGRRRFVPISAVEEYVSSL